MKRYTANKTQYDIISSPTTSWLTVNKNGKYYSNCMDEETARQSIYADITADGSESKFLTKADFVEFH